MKNHFKFFSIFFFQFCFLINVKAQSSNFNLDAYKQFLQSHQNISTQSLLQLYNAGRFSANIKQDYNSAVYFDSIDAKYNLTNYEKSLLQQNGFVVSERLTMNSFGDALNDIYAKDLPVFISTDAILHALHMSYDNILKDIELSVLVDSVKSMLTQMRSGIPVLAASYSNNPAMIQMLKDVDFYLAVGIDLFGQQVNPIYPDNTTKISGVISKINAANGIGYDTLFSSIKVLYDWSQFKPRGHYVDDLHPILANYFRAMMWLGRTEIYLLQPRALVDADSIEIFNSIQRQTINAMLIRELFDKTNVAGTYNLIESVLTFFVGEQDNVTIDNLAYLKNAVSLNNASDLLDSLKLVTFQDTLKNQSLAYQMILSQLLAENPLQPDSIIPASSFLLFGQRFIIDSYVLGNVVYDRTKSCRLFPSSLDPMFALGNNAAAQLLQDEITKYVYGGNLAALRYLIDSYGSDFWNKSFYNLWLNSIRSLNPPVDKSSLPLFMQTAGFWQEKLNTQLASWTELRHDNLLYAKQSYTGMSTCSYPYTYIEPFPEFYKNLKTLAEVAQKDFSNLNITNNYLMPRVINYLDNLGKVADTLYTIAQKELNGISFTSNEINFLKHAFNPVNTGCSGDLPPFIGWYNTLYYGFNDIQLFDKNYLVADVHTIPTDCVGNVMGWVKHVGTGPVNLGIFIAPLPGNQITAFVGPVMSYYEYTSTNFLRLTDQEWKDSALTSALRPTWVNNYLADINGASRGPGESLITGILYKDQQNIPDSYLIVKAFPNPFNPTTTLSITIPSKLSNSLVQLFVYDIQGRLVKKLINQNLAAGNYLYKWDGRNNNGINVSSGVYLMNLRASDQVSSAKILFLK
ncbi:MAG: DUF3160 domain-containing protein [Bacteroidetes bacterium]|nr:DUF3160 domain-containing protein [Bacteroidota bacterium]